jgi:SAM-dependent methyltransferase
MRALTRLDHEIRHQKAFFERLAGRYADGYRVSIPFLERVKLAATPHVRGRVLDIGNGGLLGFDPARAASVTVADLCAASLRTVKTVDGGRIRALDGAERRALRCVQASAMELPFEDGAFDVAAMFYVAHHLSVPTRKGVIRNIARALSEVHRVLAPGGAFVFLENCPTRLPKLAQDLGFALGYAVLSRFGKPLPYFLSEQEILRYLAAAGFHCSERARIAWAARVHQPMFPSIAPPGWLWELLLTNRMFVARKAGGGAADARPR